MWRPATGVMLRHVEQEMEGESALQVFAEVSVALAGFTGVVAVFRERGPTAWTPVDFLRFRVMLGTSLAALLLSLLPFGLHGLGLGASAMWATCSGAFALYLVVVLPLDFRRARRMGVGREADFNPWVPAIGGVLGASALVIQVLNVVGIGFERQAGPFLVGLVLLIGICALMFALMLGIFGRGVGP